MLTLKAFQDRLADFEARGAQIVAISPQSPSQCQEIVKKSGVTFPVLSDESNRVAKKFQLLYHMDTPLPGNAYPWPLPMATTYVIDSDASVAYSHVNADPSKRAEPTDVLKTLPSKTQTKKKRGSFFFFGRTRSCSKVQPAI